VPLQQDSCHAELQHLGLFLRVAAPVRRASHTDGGLNHGCSLRASLAVGLAQQALIELQAKEYTKGSR